MSDLKDQLVVELERLGVEHKPVPGRDDGFSGLSYKGKDIAHFHGFNELDLKLGKTLIKREGLTHNPKSRVHPGRSPNSAWIELPFSQASDLPRIVQLVKLAISQIG